MPLDLAALVAPAHTALVLQEVQNGVVGEPSALPALAEAAAAVDLIPHCAALAQRGAAASGSRCSTAPPRPATTCKGANQQRAPVPRRAEVAGAALARERRGAGARRRSASTRATSCCRATTGSAR